MTAGRAWSGIIFLTLIALLPAACRSAGPAAGGDEAAAVITAEPTRAGVALATPSGPPDIDNDAPAGICENTANILSRVDRATTLFRAVALDNRVGTNDGDGIRGVRFAVVGDGLTYAKDEVTAPYCLLGGNEPDCGRWPRNDNGLYTWGAGGPVVQPGTYQVFVEVVAEQPDSLSGRDRCDWSFTMRILLRQN